MNPREQYIQAELRKHDGDYVLKWLVDRAAIMLVLCLIAGFAHAAVQHKVTYAVSLYKGTTKVHDVVGSSVANAQANCELELAKQATAASYSCKTPVTTDVVTVVPDPPPVVGPVLQFTATYATQYKPLSGAIVMGKVNVALSDCSIAGDWTFYLDGKQANAEGGCPYEFLGDGTMWDSSTVANGSHTIEARGPKSIAAAFIVTNAVPVPPTPIPSGSATLSWVPPTQNTDGSPLTDLEGYTVRYGTSMANMDQTVAIHGAGITTYLLRGLSPGTWYFTIDACTSMGACSERSNAVSKTL